MIVEGGVKNTHYQSHQKYLKELEKIRNLQQKQQQDQYDEMQPTYVGSNYDYYADDEDLSQPKGTINSLLEGQYTLELVSIGFLFSYFTLLKMLTSEAENAVVVVADKRKRM